MQIEGLTTEQVELLDKMWSIDTHAELSAWFNTLNEAKRQEAMVLLELIELAAIDDQVDEDQDLTIAKLMLNSIL